ncbi:MAG TPA: hypothetical protein VF992_01350 [Thermoplasmata archaeon]
MQVGCGFRIKDVGGHRYVYFWHYEDRAGRSRQVYEYVGPCRAASTADRLQQALDRYYASAEEDLRRQRVRARASIARLGA